MSLWTESDALRHFAFRSAHREVLARRREWFATLDQVYSVPWRIPAGHIPSLEEAVERLECLRRDGPCPRAFSFSKSFQPD